MIAKFVVLMAREVLARMVDAIDIQIQIIRYRLMLTRVSLAYSPPLSISSSVLNAVKDPAQAIAIAPNLRSAG
jgi:hypothetical protein